MSSKKQRDACAARFIQQASHQSETSENLRSLTITSSPFHRKESEYTTRHAAGGDFAVVDYHRVGDGVDSIDHEMLSSKDDGTIKKWQPQPKFF
jgi:hypothetical protein